VQNVSNREAHQFGKCESTHDTSKSFPLPRRLLYYGHCLQLPQVDFLLYKIRNQGSRGPLAIRNQRGQKDTESQPLCQQLEFNRQLAYTSLLLQIQHEGILEIGSQSC